MDLVIFLTSSGSRMRFLWEFPKDFPKIYLEFPVQNFVTRESFITAHWLYSRPLPLSPIYSRNILRQLFTKSNIFAPSVDMEPSVSTYPCSSWPNMKNNSLFKSKEKVI